MLLAEFAEAGPTQILVLLHHQVSSVVQRSVLASPLSGVGVSLLGIIGGLVVVVENDSARSSDVILWVPLVHPRVKLGDENTVCVL